MKINIKNIKKIDTEIKAVEGKATARLLNSTDINYYIEKAEKLLNTVCLPKKYWVGCKIKINPEGVSKSYAKKYSAFGTYCTIQRFSSGWFVIEISRSYVGTGTNDKLVLSETAKNNIPDLFYL